MRRMVSRVLAAAALLTFSSGCEKVFGTVPGRPDPVADLELVGSARGGLTVRWTQVEDGGKKPALYSVVVSDTPFVFDSLRNSGKVVTGNAVDSVLVFTVDELAPGTEYRVQVAAFRLEETGEWVFGSPSNVVTGTTDADPPRVVEDLAVASLSTTAVTLQWTQVDDGAGRAANYRLRYGTPTVNWTATSPATLSIAGTTVGSSRTASISGLTAETPYEFQLESVAGSTADPANLGSRSTVASATTPPIAPVGGVSPFFSDNFDNGTRTNANGFTWSSPGSRVSVSPVRSLSGSHSMALRFGPDTLGKDSSAEARFSLGRNLTELWIEYFLFVPSNYSHRNDSPTNNKFFRIWGDSYSSSNKVGASTTFVSGGSSNLLFEYNFKGWGDGVLGFGPNSPAGAKSPATPFGTLEMRDRWTRVRIHLRQVSAADADDAILQIWLGETLMLDFRNVPQKFDPLRPHWNAGYLMGWANSGFAEETIFYLDDVKFFSQNPGW